MDNKLAVIAIGGNSLIADIDHQAVEDQYSAICVTARHIVDLIEDGYNVVVTHGNGPQVGFILRRSEIAHETAGMHSVPLVSCGADTQGAIGYQIQQAMDNEFKERGLDISAITVVTQVEVDKNDQAFVTPTKPIGTFYNDDQMKKIEKEHPDWNMVSDAGRGFRRVVASPKPVNIIEKKAIDTLIGAGFNVIAVGGGGIPVIKDEDGKYTGVDAVIDKDFATSLLAVELNADLLIISTGVPQVALNFNTPQEKKLETVTLSEIKQYMKEGHFAPGSMLPKIEAVVSFIEKGGKKAIITDPEHIKMAVAGKTGTHIVK
ncbi:MAG: carbamate kinase [Spirochaetaceae bacterium]|jgi:carbamate kinase|nr:carbamate kinase [Spirochaetaceae bacterium]